jgi:2-oxoglutarate dehydrogenase E2 component (dihydrolipoamide succinyltransferase)
MAVEIKVPDMGESVIEATVARWMKQEGESVSAGEPVVELETDKVNLEVGSQQAGVLQRIEKQAGDTVAVGDVLAWVDAGDGNRGVPAPRDGSRERDGKDGAEKPAPVQAGQAAKKEAAAPGQPVAAVQATPVAMRMAQEQGIDLAKVVPTGPGGRITKEDVESFLRKMPAGNGPASNAQELAAAPGKPPQELAAGRAAPGQTTAPVPQAAATAGQAAIFQSDAERPQTRVRMTRRRQTIARRLVEAQHTAAMLTTFNEVDMSRVMELRKRRREEFKERFGVDLGFMPFFVKACIGALKAFPNVNAELASTAQGEELVLKHYYDIGIAIGAEEGLVVPVIRDADRLNFAGIEKAIRGFVEKTKNGALTLDDLRGGTFTITNGGVYGSLMSTPILNPPQVGILGMHAIKERAVVVNGEIVARPMMYLALSYDHRVVDGREAVQFLVRVKELVEDPEALLLG